MINHVTLLVLCVWSLVFELVNVGCEHWFFNPSFNGWDSLLHHYFWDQHKCKNHHATSAVCPSQDFQMVQKSWRKKQMMDFDGFWWSLWGLDFSIFWGMHLKTTPTLFMEILENPGGWTKFLLNKGALFEHLVDFPHIQQKHLTRYWWKEKDAGWSYWTSSLSGLVAWNLLDSPHSCWGDALPVASSICATLHGAAIHWCSWPTCCTCSLLGAARSQDCVKAGVGLVIEGPTKLRIADRSLAVDGRDVAKQVR